MAFLNHTDDYNKQPMTFVSIYHPTWWSRATFTLCIPQTICWSLLAGKQVTVATKKKKKKKKRSLSIIHLQANYWRCEWDTFTIANVDTALCMARIDNWITQNTVNEQNPPCSCMYNFHVSFPTASYVTDSLLTNKLMLKKSVYDLVHQHQLNTP